MQQRFGNRGVSILLRKATAYPEGDAGRANPDAESVGSLPAEGEALAPPQTARMERAFDHDFGDVRIHTDSASAGAAEQLQAHAFTIGSDIYFGRGEFRPGTAEGDRLLAHELSHVVQHDEGRLDGPGVSRPTDPSEREADQGIPAAEPAIDTAAEHAVVVEPGPEPGGATAPTNTIHRSATTALQQDVPSSEYPTPESAVPQPAAAPAGAEDDAPIRPATTTAAPEPAAATAAAPAPSRAPALTAATGPATASPRGPSPAAAVRSPASAGRTGAQVDSAGAALAVPALDVQGGAPGGALAETPAVASATPDLVDATEWAARARATEWAARAREEGVRAGAGLRATAAETLARIEAAALTAVAEVHIRFADARGRLEVAAADARQVIATAEQSGAARVEAGVGAAEAGLEAYFAQRSAQAAETVGGARGRYAAVVETEATRVVDESAVRAERAKALGEQSGRSDEPELSEGLVDIARQVAEGVAEQCIQTGADAAVEVRNAGAARDDGFDGYAEDYFATLADARQKTLAALATIRDDALEGLSAQAERLSDEVGAQLTVAMSGLDGQEENLVGWITEEGGTESASTSDKAEAWADFLGQAFYQLAESYDLAGADVDAALADPGEDLDPAAVEQVRRTVGAELASLWVQYAAPLLAEEMRLTGLLDWQGGELETGLAAAVRSATGELEGAAAQAVDGLADLGARSADFAGQCAEQAVRVAQEGTAAAHSEVGRAEAEFRSGLDGELEDATSTLRDAVDEQLSWEDEQIGKAAQEIARGQARAAVEYETTKVEAEARNEQTSEPTISRSWLGDLWDVFSNWAQSVLEWFQEKLGRIWGSIIGGILAALIYVVGVVVAAVAWVLAQVVNLVWGFLWGETAIPGAGGGVVAFIGDLIAGILIYGDVRDIIKYGLIRPLQGEGPWWFNLTMVVIAAIGLIPVFGDIFKAVKARKLLKAGLKEIAERLVKELGRELADKLMKEVGEEAAEELLEKLGKEALQKAAADLSGSAIKEIIEKLGERAVKKLLEELGGAAVERVGKELSQDAVEKLLRTVGGNTVHELSEKLGKDAVEKLLTGLRGVTVKEYLDLLGDSVLKRLAGDLDGYAVKELVDELGGDVIKRLAATLDGSAVKSLLDELGGEALKRLGAKLDGTVVKQLVGDLGAAEVKRLLQVLGDDAFTKLAGEVGGAVIKELERDLGSAVLTKLSADLTGTAIKQLADDLGAEVVKKLSADLSGTAVKQLADDLGKDLLQRLVADLSGGVIKQLGDELGTDVLKKLAGDLSGTAIKEYFDALGGPLLKELGESMDGQAIKALVDELGAQTVKDLGGKAIKEIGTHLGPAEIKQWVADLGVARLKVVAEKYGGDAMKHYGSAWMKAYQGITAQTFQHVVVGDGIAGAVKGCHDTANFVARHVTSVGAERVHIVSQTVAGAITRFRYSTINAVSGLPNQGIKLKTTMQDLAANWGTISDELTKALDQLIRNKAFPSAPGPGPAIHGVQGATWNWFFRNGMIDSIFPI